MLLCVASAWGWKREACVIASRKRRRVITQKKRGLFREKVSQIRDDPREYQLRLRRKLGVTNMAVHATWYAPERYELTTDEHVKINMGLDFWHDHSRFSDEQVDEVKGIFRKIFGIPPNVILMGMTFPDSIVLQPSNDEHIFYALLAVENEEDGSRTGGWEALELKSDGIIYWVTSTPLRLVLSLLASGSGGITHEIKKKND